MRDELVRRNYAATTIRTYLHGLDTCRRQHPSRRLDRLGLRELRRYQAYLFEERKLAIGLAGLHVAALRFLFCPGLETASPEGGAADPEASPAAPGGLES